MTDDEAFEVVATKAGAFSADELRDFCKQTPAVQDRIARVYQSAIFEQGGAGAWADFLVVFDAIVPLVTEASGLGSAFETLKGLR